MDKLYTIPEFAEMLKISKAKAYRIIKDEGIILIRIGPRTNRLTQAQIDSMLNKWKHRD